MRHSLPSVLALVAFLALSALLAFGPGHTLRASVQEGIEQIGGVDLPQGDQGLRKEVVDIINYLLSFLALAAIVAIIAAGLFFILGAGSEGSIQRGKKIIIYTIIGLLIIFFVRAIVGFFQDLPVS